MRNSIRDVTFRRKSEALTDLRFVVESALHDVRPKPTADEAELVAAALIKDLAFNLRPSQVLEKLAAVKGAQK